MNRLVRAAGRLLADVAAIALIVLAIAMLSGRVAVQPVLSGSMSGYADRGDLAIALETGAAGLEVGDVVMFAPPSPWEPPGNHPVAHRIIELRVTDGQLTARTKGDANREPDPWTLDLSRTRTAEVRAVVPYAGWPFIRLAVLTTPAGRIGVGLSLMAAGAVLLFTGRRSRPDEADEPDAPVPCTGDDISYADDISSGGSLAGPRRRQGGGTAVLLDERPLVLAPELLPRQRRRELVEPRKNVAIDVAIDAAPAGRFAEAVSNRPTLRYTSTMRILVILAVLVLVGSYLVHNWSKRG
ncbi:hypothetical protein GCM10009547_48930 [Sporichthya brevicatena]|uniref:Signal peptidase I n=1 Tax=Sporichthya brevicatena TaxID=171442 RepID=A0ABN1HD77_9ACTN